MINFRDWNLTDFLMATPYGGKRSPKEKITEEEFYNEGFFIEPVSWNNLGKEMVSFFNIAGAGNINTILLHGYQGTGKTTFLHWVFEKREFFNDYGKMILDMEIPSKSKSPYSIFDTFFRLKLNDFYAEEPIIVVNLLKFLLIHFSHLNCITFTTQYNDGESFWHKLIALDKGLKSSDNQNPCIEDKSIIADFFEKLNYTDTFLLFLLIYFYLDDINYKKNISQKPTKHIKSFIIIFDNIDSVRMEQTNAEFPATIAYLYEQFCEIIETFKWEAPILNFIYSVRDYNYSLLELQNIDFRQTKEIDFAVPENIDKIMKQRINIANNYGQYKNISAILEVFFYDYKFEEVFLPLFNYNIRKLAINFSFFSEILSSDNVQNFLNMKQPIEENKITIANLSWSYRNGLRGLFYAVIIKALLEKDNLRPVLLYEEGEEIDSFEEGGEKYGIKINPARILLTIIHSLTKYSDIEENKRSQPVGIGDVYNEYRKMFKGEYFVDVFFDKLTGLFRLHEKNWCHLISFRNKQVFDKSVFDEEKKLLKGKVEDESFSVLNNIEVRINRSAHIYLTKVVTHYEFYSMRAKNAESLFLTTNKYKFLRNIDRVWVIVGPCLSSLINYLKKNTVENFEETNLCLRDNYGENTQKTVMAFRIIHMQLRYIDDFRKYLFFLTKTGRSNFSFKEINKKIMKKQYLYIRKLKELCLARPGRYDNMKMILLNNFETQMKIGYDQYISLLNDSRDLPSDNP